MKRIIITERQYKRLVNQPLNEEKDKGGELIFTGGYSFDDLTIVMVVFLNALKRILKIRFKKSVYIKKVENNILTIDLSKYNKKQIKTIKSVADRYFNDSEFLGDYYNSDDGEIVFEPEEVEVEDTIAKIEGEHDEDGEGDEFATGDDEEVVDLDAEEVEVEPEEVEVEPEEVDDFKPVELSEVPDDTFSSNIPKKLYDVMYLVSGGESNHNYNIQGGERSPSVTLTDKTIKQVSEGGDYGTNAKGRWQLMPEFMEERASAVGLKDTDKFSKINQDKMAMYLIKGWENWDCKKLGDKLAKIWAAVPVLYDQQGDNKEVKRGQSYYEGVSTNEAEIAVEEFETAIRKTGCVDIEDVPEIPFRNKTEGNAFRKWVNDNHKEYADKINLSPTGDWKEGQKNFKGFMLKAWNEHGKKYIDDGGYKELEEIKLEDTEICEIKPDSKKSNLSKIKFDSIPNSTNFRSGQPTLPQLAYILDTYDIKHIVRMNGNNETSPVGRTKVTFKGEKAMAECYDVEYHFINAHKPNHGVGEIVDGVTLGYTKSMEEIQKILSEGNTLIHCRNGSDRTGYQVAKYRKDRGMTDEQALWDYTLKYNGWCKQKPEEFNGGYDAYAQGFINGLDEKKRQELCNGRVNKDKIAKDYESPEIE
jgi:hypothetical protein